MPDAPMPDADAEETLDDETEAAVRGAEAESAQAATDAANAAARARRALLKATKARRRRERVQPVDPEEDERDPPPGPRAGGGGPAVPVPAPARNAEGFRTTSDLTCPSVMDGGLNRADSRALAEQLAARRRIRSDLSARLVGGAKQSHRGDELERLIDVLTDREASGVKMSWNAHDNRYVLAEEAAGAAMPTPTEVLSSGVSREFLSATLNGSPCPAAQCTPGLAWLGIKNSGGWEYMHRQQQEGYQGPTDYNFFWGKLSEKTKKPEAEGETAAKAPVIKDVWSTLAGKMMSRAKSASKIEVFSLLQHKSVTKTALRDCCYMLYDEDGGTNKYRVPMPNDEHDHRAKPMLNEDNCTIPFNGTVVQVQPEGMKETVPGDSNTRYVESFRNPEPLRRTGDTPPVGDNEYQKRLDYFNRIGALPSCVAPTRFTLGSPIQVDEATGGIYFNKYIAAEHAALVVEIGAALATFPGLWGLRREDDFPVPRAWAGAKPPQTKAEAKQQREEARAISKRVDARRAAEVRRAWAGDRAPSAAAAAARGATTARTAPPTTRTSARGGPLGPGRPCAARRGAGGWSGATTTSTAATRTTTTTMTTWRPRRRRTARTSAARRCSARRSSRTARASPR